MEAPVTRAQVLYYCDCMGCREMVSHGCFESMLTHYLNGGPRTHWDAGRCAFCGYALGGGKHDRCPECGKQQPAESASPGAYARRRALAAIPLAITLLPPPLVATAGHAPSLLHPWPLLPSIPMAVGCSCAGIAVVPLLFLAGVVVAANAYRWLQAIVRIGIGGMLALNVLALMAGWESGVRHLGAAHTLQVSALSCAGMSIIMLLLWRFERTRTYTAALAAWYATAVWAGWFAFPWLGEY